jgi:hypothetical protein
MMDMMHDGEPYGHLTAGTVPIAPEEIARMEGVPASKVVRWIAELDAKSVFSRTPEGVIYSRRMVHDEEIRRKRAASGILGGNPALLVNQGDNLTGNLKPTPATASASAVASAKNKQKRVGEYTPDFLTAWAEYPSRMPASNKKQAFKAWNARIADGADPQAMIAGTKAYAAYCFKKSILNSQYVKQAATFFGPDEHYATDWTFDPATGRKAGEEGSESATARKDGDVAPTTPRTGSMLKPTEKPKNTAEENHRVDAWSHAHPEEAATLHTECKSVIDASFEGMNATARERLTTERFKQRVLAEKLIPKIAEVA